MGSLFERLHEAQGAALAFEEQRIQGEQQRVEEVLAWDDLRERLSRVFRGIAEEVNGGGGR